MFELSEDNQKVYRIINQKEIPEQAMVSVELEHIVTKAKIILFICDDENRVFNIAFKTPVENGKGTPHILEHSVLCGSRKYNIKDPFIELAKSSMNTFLNAMTFPDKTCYPVASANLKDFHNLVDVYLDAVFYPNAIKNDKIFKQEGWHYEIENENDDLKVNGVVYNEMKGVYSDPDSILETATLSNLFNGTNYAYESGGNPDEIIDLTFDEFVSFHHKYYSATNSIVYYYGKLDYNEELAYLHNSYFKDMEKVEVDANFSEVKKIEHDKEQIDYYNVDSENYDDKSYFAYSFALPFKKTSLKLIVMAVINYVLFKSDSAILKEKLMNEGFGKSIESKISTELKTGFYAIIAKEVNENKKDKFKSEIISFIKGIVDNGLNVDMIKAGINSEYFGYAEGEFGRLPRGILLSIMSLETCLYGESPYTFIEYKEAFDYLNKVDLNDKNNIFIETLKEVFLDNEWTAINVLNPKKNLLKEKDEKLAGILKDRKEKFGSSGIKNIIEDVKELKSYQKETDSEENLKTIPKLKVSDIDSYKSIINYKNETIANTNSVICLKNDKDIVYLNVSFEIGDFSKEEFLLVSLIKLIIAKIDLDNISYQEFNNYIDINTGGLQVAVTILENTSLLTFSVKSTSDKIDIAFDILYRVFSEVNFNDKSRIELLINEAKSVSQLYILSTGHGAALTRSASTDEYSSWVGDKVSRNGIAYNKFMCALCKTYSENSDKVNTSILETFKKVLSNKMHFQVCTNEKYLSKVKDEFLKFKDLFNKNVLSNIDINANNKMLENDIQDICKFIDFESFEKKVKREAIVTPNDVNFCAISGKFDKNLFTGHLLLLKTLFNYEYLWTNIRVLGGAYGCLSAFKRTGDYDLVSYRDPNVANTNKIYYEVPNYLKSIKISKDEIEKYIIGSIAAFDNPISTYELFNINIGAYFNNQTDEDYNARRQEIINMKPEDLNKLADIFGDINNANACALITESKIDEAKKEYDVVWRLIEQ